MAKNKSNLNKVKEAIIDQLMKESLILKFDGMVDSGMITVSDFYKFKNAIKDNNLKLVKIEKQEVMNNAYLQNISIPRAQKNNFSLNKRRIIKRELVTKYLEKSRDIDTFEQTNTFFYCEDNLRFPGIVEGDTAVSWMTVEPFEIKSFAPFINEASGNVLLCGLGMGYAAYMLSLKDSITSIDIVELNEDVIALFTEEILPQFEHKDKVNIIKGNAIAYLKNEDLSEYDYINVDIWRDTPDMLPLYLECLEIESKYDNVDFSYWLEPELKEAIQSSLLASITGYNLDMIYNRMIADDILKGRKIHNIEDIRDMIKLDNFREVMLNWYLNNKEKTKEMKEQIDFITAKSMAKMKTLDAPFRMPRL